MKPVLIKDVVAAVEGKLLSGNPEKTISSVSTNSKDIKEEALFVPIIGERTDAHIFIKSAFEAGAVASFTSRNESGEDINTEKAYIKVEDTLMALQKLAAWYRSLFPIPVIGVTGSVGKTTTKEMISAVLETKYKVLKTSGNMNSQVGLPLTIFNIEDEHEAAVIEMGMSNEGEMERLADIARPTDAVMTNIGVSHIEQLKTRENIRKEKLNIVNYLSDNGSLYLNGDDELLSEITGKADKDKIEVSEKSSRGLSACEIVFFGIEHKADLYASDIVSNDGKTSFKYKSGDEEEPVILNVLGKHNVLNALAALGIAKKFGISTDIAKKGLEAYSPVAMRGCIYEKDGIKIIDDTYNASPDSMKSSVDVLLTLTGVKRRIVVFADSLELGDISYKCHYEVGEYISQRDIQEVITIGKESRAITEAINNSKAQIVTHSYDTNKEAVEYLKNVVAHGDAMLVKGSRGMHTDEIVEAFK